MVRFVLVFLTLIFSLNSKADFLGLGPSESRSPILELVEKLKGLEMKVDPSYEEEFNKAVKNLENGIEQEKLYCAGESPDSEGKTLQKDGKALCMRELKKDYLNAMDVIFEMKKKYLGMIHSRQQERLAEVHKKLKNDIEKNF